MRNFVLFQFGLIQPYYKKFLSFNKFKTEDVAVFFEIEFGRRNNDFVGRFSDRFGYSVAKV